MSWIAFLPNIGGGTVSFQLPANEYFVNYVGPSSYQVIKNTGVLGVYASLAAAITAALSDTPTTSPVVIWLDALCDGDTQTVTINRSNVAIVTGVARSMENGGTNWSTPRITTVVIDSTAQDITNILLQGFSLRQLDFNANGHAIQGVWAKDCGFRPSGGAGAKGIRFLGNSVTYYIRFIDCQMSDYYDQTVDQLGAISFQNAANVGCGQIYFIRWIYKSATNNTTMACWGAAARLDQVIEWEDLNYVEITKTGCIVFRFKDGSKLGTMMVKNPTYECHDTMTIFQIDVGHTGGTHRLQIHHDNMHMTAPVVGDTVTFITNNAVDADYYAPAMSYFVGKGNKAIMDTGLGTFALGTPGVVAHFTFDFGYTVWNGLVPTNVNPTTG